MEMRKMAALFAQTKIANREPTSHLPLASRAIPAHRSARVKKRLASPGQGRARMSPAKARALLDLHTERETNAGRGWKAKDTKEAQSSRVRPTACQRVLRAGAGVVNAHSINAPRPEISTLLLRWAQVRRPHCECEFGLSHYNNYRI